MLVDCLKEFNFLDSELTFTPLRRSELENLTDNPMQPEPANLAEAPRCGAKTRSGSSCKSPAVGGRQRCRMHGGTNKGAPKGNRNAWKHGDRSAEAEEQLKTIRDTDRVLQLLGKLRQGIALRTTEMDRLMALLIEQGYSLDQLGTANKQSRSPTKRARPPSLSSDSQPTD